MKTWNVVGVHRSGDERKDVHEFYGRKADADRHAKALLRSGEYLGIRIYADDGEEILDETEKAYI